MHPSNRDFAHPVVKTVACFICLLAFPAFSLLAPKDSHAVAYWVAGIVSLTSLLIVCGRPSLIETAIRQISPSISAWRGSASGAQVPARRRARDRPRTTIIASRNELPKLRQGSARDVE